MVKRVRVFLASSSELVEDRRAFEILVNRKNKEWVGRGVFIELVLWEDFLDFVSKTRLQDEYDDEIRDCDLFVLLFWSKVGRYSAEEFETAVGQFKATNKPFILVYFKSEPVPGGVRDEDRQSLEAFEDRLEALGHYKTAYHNIDRLTGHFSQQLDKLVASGFIRFEPEAPPRRRPFQAPPPEANLVQRAEVTTLKALFLDAKAGLRHVTVGLHGFGGAGKTTLARLLCADAALRQACRDGMLWVAMGKNPPDARAQIADLVVALTGSDDGCLTLPGARAQLQEALAGRRLLLVIDDVWDEAHVRELLQASAACARLITTRMTFTLPPDAQPVDVREMQADESRQLLAQGLNGVPDARLDALAARLGHWPVLLKLVHRALWHRVTLQKTPAPAAVDAVDAELTRKGVVAFDPRLQVQQRDQAVAATIDASLEMLDPMERQRCTELAIFPQDVAIPLAQAAALWRLTGGIDADAAADLVVARLDPLSIIDYDGGTEALRVHDVLRRYLASLLPDRAGLHGALSASWSDRPSQAKRYAWRWLAFHRAAEVRALPDAKRHAAAQRLITLAADADWQRRHEAALADLPALREALTSALDAAVAVPTPGAAALLVEAADTLRRFDREHASPDPVFELARRGDLNGARRRSELFLATVDVHWRHALLLTVAWLAPTAGREAARALAAEVQRSLGDEPALHDLAAWVRAELMGDAPPAFASEIKPDDASPALIEQLLQRVGGGAYDREMIASAGIDAGAQNPDMPTRGMYRTDRDEGTTTHYLADIDGPWLVAHAAVDFTRGMAALARYLSVYTNYSYAEYRYANLWLLLGHVLHIPRTDAGPWLREAVVSILGSALGGASVEFEQALPVAVQALHAAAGDDAARQALAQQADDLCVASAAFIPGRGERSDTWGHEKRRLLAHAQALGWLLNDRARARALIDAALRLAESGFAGYQAMACMALAETAWVVGEGGPPVIDEALHQAQRAAHNVQDLTFCARLTARVNALRRHWWRPFEIGARARQLGDGVPRPEFAALHRVGQGYEGRAGDALQWPAWAADDSSFELLARRYQRLKDDFLRLNGADRPLALGEEIGVPDGGIAPHLAARLAAEVLALAGNPLDADAQAQLRALVPHALPSPTALDAVLARVVLAEGRRDTGLVASDIDVLDALLARRPAADAHAGTSELIATRLPA
jgi:hypothetical protein